MNTQVEGYKRPDILEGRTIKLKTPCGGFYLTLNYDNINLREVRMLIGKSGSCQRLLFETIGILISILLQSDIPREKLQKALYHQFDGNCGNDKIWYDGYKYDSCVAFVVRRLLEEMANRGEIEIEEEEKTIQTTT